MHHLYTRKGCAFEVHYGGDDPADKRPEGRNRSYGVGGLNVLGQCCGGGDMKVYRLTEEELQKYKALAVPVRPTYRKRIST